MYPPSILILSPEPFLDPTPPISIAIAIAIAIVIVRSFASSR